MPFPRKLLNDGEEVVLDLRPHWWFLSGPVAAVVALLVATILLRYVDYLSLVALGLLVLALLWLGARYLRWTTTNFVVTTDRLVHRAGVVAKRGREIPLGRVNDIAFNQSIFERLIRAGDLIIESGGERGQQMFSDIPRPAAVQNEIYRQMDAAQARDAARWAVPAPPSIPEQLEKLDELCRRGVISRAEFEAKKAQLLERM